MKEGNLENALLSLFCGGMPHDAEIRTRKVVFPSRGFCFAFSSFMREIVLISLSFRVVCGVEGHECVLDALVLKCCLFTVCHWCWEADLGPLEEERSILNC